MSLKVDSYQKKIHKILKFAFILFIVTLIELILAFLWPEEYSRTILIVLFIVMTIVKAYYIVLEFMHLGHETAPLRMSILIPLIFIIFLIYVILDEGFEVFSHLF